MEYQLLVAVKVRGDEAVYAYRDDDDGDPRERMRDVKTEFEDDPQECQACDPSCEDSAIDAYAHLALSRSWWRPNA